ncbi:hypothetical protein [uncultured Alistipes sp.]|jgi:lipoprotein|uniref:hypothetical protein n=1 Tax=uncultured Alistipes sp. TaxID=538949 RepID=UPI0025D82731|nr:hypothetical protein [uncultured Alistipes sp.]
MKKILSLAVVALSLVFGGCIKGSNSNDRYKDVWPGVNIYAGSWNQHVYATQQADMGLRVAMLVAEAEAQGETIENVKVKVGTTDVLLKGILFGTAKLEETATGYKLTFDANQGITEDPRIGVMLIDKNGSDLLIDATILNPWKVTFVGDFVKGYNATNSESITSTAGETSLYFDGMDSYVVSIAGVALYSNATKKWTSNWNSSFTITPENENFTYTDCASKAFLVEGSGSGVSFNSYDNVSASRMSIRISDGKFTGPYAATDCTLDCAVLDNYNEAGYPSRAVNVKFVTDANKERTRTISYNGFMVVDRL